MTESENILFVTDLMRISQLMFLETNKLQFYLIVGIKYTTDINTVNEKIECTCFHV